jgi:hypothetical protein
MTYRYRCISEHHASYGVARLCRVLAVPLPGRGRVGSCAVAGDKVQRHGERCTGGGLVTSART